MVHKKNKRNNKNPWPTKEAMEQVYDMKLWGDNKTDFYSGEGSHLPELIEPYITSVVSFLTSFRVPLVVCDLGCGDFNVGKQLVRYAKKYIAVDIVPQLITHNKLTFVEDNLEFECLDISKDELPVGDCVLLRQVLQHLSNTEVQNILSKLSDFKYIILTEHVPENDFVANKDIISGQGIRLKKESGINILHEPFNFKVQKERLLTSVIPSNCKGVIVTTLYTVF